MAWGGFWHTPNVACWFSLFVFLIPLHSDDAPGMCLISVFALVIWMYYLGFMGEGWGDIGRRKTQTQRPGIKALLLANDDGCHPKFELMAVWTHCKLKWGKAACKTHDTGLTSTMEENLARKVTLPHGISEAPVQEDGQRLRSTPSISLPPPRHTVLLHWLLHHHSSFVCALLIVCM